MSDTALTTTIGRDKGPTYDYLHRGHPPTEYPVTAYDVVHTSWDQHGILTIEVTEIVDGDKNYLAALDKAKALRDAEGHYGYVANRYACGCRWIATALDPALVHFRDVDPVGAAQ